MGRDYEIHTGQGAMQIRWHYDIPALKDTQEMNGHDITERQGSECPFKFQHRYCTYIYQAWCLGSDLESFNAG